MDKPNTVEGDVIAHPKHRAKVPPLPPELLLRIFHHATHVPGTLVPDIYDNASILGPLFIQQFHPALRKALITKCALVRVCRQWWHLAAPILYTSVYIGSARHVSSLCSTLERSAEGTGAVVGTRPLGEYTQRLDIITPDCDEYLYSDADCDLIRTLMQCMHHLTIFSIAATAYYANPVLPYFVLDGLRCSANSLRVLDWSSPNLHPPVSEIECLLGNCSQLRVLNCPGVHWSWETNQVTIPPTVTTLCMRTLVRVESSPVPNYSYIDRETIPPAPLPVLKGATISPAPLPALQELVLDFCGGDCSCRYLLHTYGHQLLSVHLYKPGLFPGQLLPYLHKLSQTCPNLRRLTITSNNLMGYIIESNPVCGPLTNTDYLGLRVPYSSQQDLRALFGFLEYMRPRMPSLQVVQLLDEPYVGCFLEKRTKLAKHELRQFMEANATVRLEDKDGVLLADRFKALGYM